MSASISACGSYRYDLRRDLGNHSPFAVFIMLNPSTADAEQDDPTIRRCISFAKREGCGRLIVLNLFALRATDPAVMLAHNDPEGSDNWEHFRRHLSSPHDFDPAAPRDIVIAAWGAHGPHNDQDRTVMGWLDSWAINPFCLGVTKSGQPKHPLYIKGDAPLISYGGRK